MAIGIHVARITVGQRDAQGNYINKNAATTKLKDVLDGTMHHLILPDATNPNTANYPTIDEYLTLEAAANYKLQHLDQTFVITYEAA